MTTIIVCISLTNFLRRITVYELSDNRIILEILCNIGALW